MPPAIYSLLENEIVPMYYEAANRAYPVEWMRRVKQSLQFVSANFNCQRMVGEYRSQLYEPAHRGMGARSAGIDFASARDRVRWTARVAEQVASGGISRFRNRPGNIGV